MAEEIEAKLKVGSHEEIIEKLKSLGGRFLAEQSQTDSYYDDDSRSLMRSDKCLRLRRQAAAGEEKVLLTYKGSRKNNRFKRRHEIEVEISSGDLCEQMLLALGYQKVIVVEKTRRLWQLGQCLVALDEVPLLGSFVEIEGADEKQIDEVQKSLGLEHLRHIKESYARLMDEKLHGPLRN